MSSTRRLTKGASTANRASNGGKKAISPTSIMINVKVLIAVAGSKLTDEQFSYSLDVNFKGGK